MAIEIELKAWVNDENALKRKIDAAGIYRGGYLKKDSYWRLSGKSGGKSGTPLAGPALAEYGVRIREESRKYPDGKEDFSTTVSFKLKKLRNGIEVNDEKEFGISASSFFEEFIKGLGFTRGISKEKRGWAWDCGGILAELSEIPGLGWFIELEILSDDGSASYIEAARKKLLALLEKLGVDANFIEERSYSGMLGAVKNGTFQR